MLVVRLFSVAAAFTILISPVAAGKAFAEQATSSAQQTPSDEVQGSAQQPAPETPPADQEAAPAPVPPPFPPMPRARPSHRWVDVGNHRVTPAHRRSGHSHQPPVRAHRRTKVISRQDLHRCHGMTCKQKRREHECRASLSHHDRGTISRHHHHHVHARKSVSSRRSVHHASSRHHPKRRHSS